MMGAGGYKIHNEAGIHFVTFAVVEWVDVFTRRAYRDIVVDSIKYCQQEKGLLLYCWCLMSNHIIHLVISAKEENTSDILRDLKTFTSKQIIQAIKDNPQESRRDWMLGIFEKSGVANSRNQTYQFWRQDNQPKELFTEIFGLQKLEYIHRNPIEAGIVDKAEDYLYSSARDYYGTGKGLLDVILLGRCLLVLSCKHQDSSDRYGTLRTAGKHQDSSYIEHYGQRGLKNKEHGKKKNN